MTEPAGLAQGAAITEDIDRRKMEAELRASEARYRSVVEGSLQGILIHQDDRICYANAALARMFGYASPADLVGRPLWETFVLPENDSELRARTRDILSGRPVPTHPGWRSTTQDGRTIWVSTTASRIEFQGRPAVVAFYLDITEQKRAEEALRESEAFLRMSQRTGRVGSWQWDLKTNHVRWSDGMHAIYGMAPEEFDGTLEGATKSTHPDDLPAVRASIQRLMDTGAPQPIEYRVVRPDGQIAYLWGTGEVIVGGANQPVRVLGTVVDVTERKRAEEERLQLESQVLHAQKLESLGILAGGIAHDFNNLLTSMLGYANLAMIYLPEQSPARSMLREIEKAAHRAADLTQQMLAYSGKGKFTVQPLRLDRLVEEMSQLLKTAVSKKAELQLRLEPATIEADATQIRQVVMNLITNASDALGDKAGVIRIGTGVREMDAASLTSPFCPDSLPAGIYAYVEVEDTGHGMTEETLSRIFDPFFSTKFAGRGLGLAAVLGIVRGHRGTIKATSIPGKGTQFQVFFPRSTASPPEEQTSSPADAPLPRGQGTVLVIEDEPSVRTFACRVLESAGFNVLSAENGTRGVELFNANVTKIAAVLVDLTMPLMDGLEVCRRIRSTGSEVPLFIMSGYTEAEVSSRCAGAGVNGFLKKPFDPRELLACLCRQ